MKISDFVTVSGVMIDYFVAEVMAKHTRTERMRSDRRCQNSLNHMCATPRSGRHLCRFRFLIE
jgi:hypothetical protein